MRDGVADIAEWLAGDTRPLYHGDLMILEGLVTTATVDGRPHVAAMGPGVHEEEFVTGRIRSLVLRPFPTSQTAAHLLRTRTGVFHVCDDVLLLASVVAGGVGAPDVRPAEKVAGFVLAAACRAFEFEVTAVDDSAERLWLEGSVVAAHDQRPFTGFNRAAHAVVEAAILVTRLHLLDRDDVRRRFDDLAILVEKTGGRREHEAFEMLSRRAGLSQP
jgi:hypothetical protein